MELRVDMSYMQQQAAEVRRREVATMFGSWVDATNDFVLALFPFCTTRPLRYFDVTVFEKALDFFETDAETTFEAMGDVGRELSRGIQALMRPGPSWSCEDTLRLDGPRDAVAFETILHPEYLRYSEQVYSNLLALVLRVFEISVHKTKGKAKKYRQQTLANQVKHLAENNLCGLTRGFNATVRNAIAHGGTFFRPTDIHYQGDSTGKKPPVDLQPHQFGDLLDALVDTCSGIVAALMAFVCRATLRQKYAVSDLPLGIRFMAINGCASYPGFEVADAIEREIQAGKQLDVAFKTSRSHLIFHLHEGYALAAVAQQIGGEHYARFAVGVDSGELADSTVIVDGPLLKKARTTKDVLTMLEACEGSPLWFDHGFLSSTASYVGSVGRIIASISMEAGRQHDSADGWLTRRTRFDVRDVREGGGSFFRGAKAEVVLRSGIGPTTYSLVRQVAQDAVNTVRRRLVQRDSNRGPRGIALPPERVFVKIHPHDARLRDLRKRGIPDGVLAFAEWDTSLRRLPQGWLSKPDEIVDGLRIRYGPDVP